MGGGERAVQKVAVSSTTAAAVATSNGSLAPGRALPLQRRPPPHSSCRCPCPSWARARGTTPPLGCSTRPRSTLTHTPRTTTGPGPCGGRVAAAAGGLAPAQAQAGQVRKAAAGRGSCSGRTIPPCGGDGGPGLQAAAAGADTLRDGGAGGEGACRTAGPLPPVLCQEAAVAAVVVAAIG